jgi:hypothetical protein
MRFREWHEHFGEFLAALAHECVADAGNDVQFRAGNLRRDNFRIFRRNQDSAPVITSVGALICGKRSKVLSVLVPSN